MVGLRYFDRKTDRQAKRRQTGSWKDRKVGRTEEWTIHIISTLNSLSTLNYFIPNR